MGLTEFITFICLAFATAVFMAAQERWNATKCFILGLAFPITVPVALYFMGRKKLLDRKRVREYTRQAEVTKELNDVYIPKDHIEVNPNFTDVNPFESSVPDSEWVRTVGEAIGESMADGEGPYICPFHRKYPNVPYSGCTCHK